MCFARKHLQKVWTLFTNQIFTRLWIPEFHCFKNCIRNQHQNSFDRTINNQKLTLTLTPSIFSKTTAAAALQVASIFQASKNKQQKQKQQTESQFISHLSGAFGQTNDPITQVDGLLLLSLSKRYLG